MHLNHANIITEETCASQPLLVVIILQLVLIFNDVTYLRDNLIIKRLTV